MGSSLGKPCQSALTLSKSRAKYQETDKYLRAADLLPDGPDMPKSQEWVKRWVEIENGPPGSVFHEFLKWREGFEPSVVLPLRLISSQVHSTTLPPLLAGKL